MQQPLARDPGQSHATLSPRDGLAGFLALVLTGRAEAAQQPIDRFPWPQNPADRWAETSANRQMYFRNGIWVATVGGVWLGDYHEREHALAAVEAAGRDPR